MATSEQPPAWAVRLRTERRARLWSQKTMAVMLRSAADEAARAALPSATTIQRYVRAYEAGEHRPGDLYASLYCRVFGLDNVDLFGSPQPGPSAPKSTEHDAANLAVWLATTNVSDEGITHLAEATSAIAELHTQRAAADVLAEVMALHGQTQNLLRRGRQRLRQTRELLRIDANLLAHACLLLGDVKQDGPAIAYGRVADMCAHEAEASPAFAFCARAKTARWAGGLKESADLAARGFASGAPPSTRVLLAYQEANAAALLGDGERTRQALHRATTTAATIADEPSFSAWACPPPRQAVYAISVAIRTGNPDEALHAAAMADATWTVEPAPTHAQTTWAQVRIGASIAQVMKDSLDATTSEVVPVFTLAPEYRISTVTRYLDDLDRRLRGRRFRNSTEASELRERIRDFNTAAFVLSEQEQP